MDARWLRLALPVAAVLLAATAVGGRPSTGPGPSVPVAAGATRSLGAPDATAPAAASGSAPIVSPEGSPGPAPAATPSPVAGPLPSTGTMEPLSLLLALLRIAPEDRTGYSRGLFVHWIDADGDGCDTRREVLIRDAIVRPTIGARCWLSGGRWLSRYDGLVFSDPANLQIDHVVALAEAWDSGAAAWTAARREAFANDLDAPFALIAVSAASNESKSDQDPADWLPPAASDECPFLGAWIATKVRWDLAVDPREHDALTRDLADCPATQMPYLPFGPAGEAGGAGGGVGATAAPGASGTGTLGCDPAYPTVCIPPPPPDLDCRDVPYRNFPVLAPDPHHFDGDRDGIGCET